MFYSDFSSIIAINDENINVPIGYLVENGMDKKFLEYFSEAGSYPCKDMEPYKVTWYIDSVLDTLEDVRKW